MDSEEDMSNVSGNNLNNGSRHVHYDDIDEYLDEAMDSDEYSDDDDEVGAKKSVSKPLNTSKKISFTLFSSLILN